MVTDAAEAEGKGLCGKHAMSPDVDNEAIEPNGSSLLELTYKFLASSGVTFRLGHKINIRC